MAIPSFNSDMGNISLLDNQVVIDSLGILIRCKMFFLASSTKNFGGKVSWEQLRQK